MILKLQNSYELISFSWLNFFHVWKLIHAVLLIHGAVNYLKPMVVNN